MEGSSSSRIFGAAMSARPMASICCSPPLKVPPDLLLSARKHGEQIEHGVHIALHVAVVVEYAVIGPQKQIIPHRQASENFSALRHKRNALCHSFR